MTTISHHYLIELRRVTSDKLDDIVFVRNALVDAVREGGAGYLDDVFHKFSPQGVSGVVVISESHVSIHTWPESGYAALDVFTCGDPGIGKRVTKLIIEKFQPERYTVDYIRRGL